MNTIELSMWDYQSLFQISAQGAAEGLFSELATSLAPNVFLIGVLAEERENHHPICLEPEDCGYELSRLADVKEQAQHLEAVNEERRALKSAVQRTIGLDDEYRRAFNDASSLWATRIAQNGHR